MRGMIGTVHDETSLESQLKGQVGDVVEVVEHPSLGPPTDEMKIGAEAANRVLSGSSR